MKKTEFDKMMKESFGDRVVNIPKKEVNLVYSGCLGTKIKAYSLVVSQDEDMRDEIEYLVNLILDDAPTRKEEILDVLEDAYKNHIES
jgi:hypothetical protein